MLNWHFDGVVPYRHIQTLFVRDQVVECVVATATASDPVPSLFTALQEQLGLRLESAKGPVDVLVIESVQKPTEN